MSGTSFNTALYEAIKQDASSHIKEKSFTLFGHKLVARQPDLLRFRQAQNGVIKDPTNPDEVEAAMADTDGTLFRMVVLCVRDLDGNQVFPGPEAVSSLPIHEDVTAMINAVAEVANFDSLLKEETGNSEETQSDAQSSN